MQLGLAAFVQICRLSGVKTKCSDSLVGRLGVFLVFFFPKKRVIFGLVKYGIASAFQFLYIALERRIHCSHGCRFWLKYARGQIS